MERTESIIVQVAPAYENAKIQQMQLFGWSLQGRQEIHEEGDAEGGPSIFGDAYVIKTTVSHYVKLHFGRPLSTPNLDRIKPIESEYFSLPFPGGPSLKWPIGLGLLFLIPVFNGDPNAPGGSRGFALLLVGLCAFWAYKRIQTRSVARAACEVSLARQQELEEQLRSM